MSAIRSLAYLNQPIDFRGLAYGRLRPTDIDGLYDLKGQAWVIIEVKRRGSAWPRGQMIALERLASDLMQVRPTLAIRAVHDQYDSTRPVILASCDVYRYMTYPAKTRWSGHWRTPDSHALVKEMIDTFVFDIWNIEGLERKPASKPKSLIRTFEESDD